MHRGRGRRHGAGATPWPHALNAPNHAPLWSVALVGNPNCGKTALFNLLTGARQKVANYAGVTVERKVGLTAPGATAAPSRSSTCPAPTA